MRRLLNLNATTRASGLASIFKIPPSCPTLVSSWLPGGPARPSRLVRSHTRGHAGRGSDSCRTSLGILPRPGDRRSEGARRARGTGRRRHKVGARVVVAICVARRWKYYHVPGGRRSERDRTSASQSSRGGCGSDSCQTPLGILPRPGGCGRNSRRYCTCAPSRRLLVKSTTNTFFHLFFIAMKPARARYAAKNKKSKRAS